MIPEQMRDRDAEQREQQEGAALDENMQPPVQRPCPQSGEGKREPMQKKDQGNPRLRQNLRMQPPARGAWSRQRPGKRRRRDHSEEKPVGLEFHLPIIFARTFTKIAFSSSRPS